MNAAAGNPANLDAAKGTSFASGQPKSKAARPTAERASRSPLHSPKGAAIPLLALAVHLLSQRAMTSRDDQATLQRFSGLVAEDGIGVLTQTQALSPILFLYRCLLDRKIRKPQKADPATSLVECR